MLTTRFDPFFSPFASTRSVSRTRSIPIDVLRHDDHLEIVADLPGVDPDAVELSVENRVLTLAFDRPVPEGADFAVQGRGYGAYRTELSLSAALDGSGTDASFDSGVLTITIPFADEAKPKKVLISTAPAAELAAESETGDEGDPSTN
jgi:HSP20 family protein